MTDFLQKAAYQYVTDLHGPEGARGLDWLAGRMIDAKTSEAGEFGLGYVLNPLPGHEAYRGCIAIPYIRADGVVVKIRFRPIAANATVKYLDVAGASPRPYNVRALTQYSPFVCITEGEFDAVAAGLSGLPAVGIPGVELWSSSWARLFRQYRTVFMLQDGDDAGEKLARTIARDVPQLRPVRMGETKHDDVNQLFITQGRDAVRAKIGL
ncbi:toprim domain-containing protein (plasmid) [Streptomyces sp. BI20]|uniref:toprim domain-containing protein n=1 Tax=Streptomyces sp. BI20 TaxID=3403460 RepID=UPI003C71FA54